MEFKMCKGDRQYTYVNKIKLVTNVFSKRKDDNGTEEGEKGDHLI